MQNARSLSIALAAWLFITPALAKNFAVPNNNPAVTVTVPDSWKTQDIGSGYLAQSPDDTVYFSVEFANSPNGEKLMANHIAWMKENNIKVVKPAEANTTLNNIPVSVYQFETSDDAGQTTVEFIMMRAGSNRIVMFTIWASDAERAKNTDALASIYASIKPIN